jgi:L-iditol 2-dehydrogenase
MKIVRITGTRQCELAERPDPIAAGDFVVVKNLIAPMCTEYKAYAGGWQTENLGHEAAGEVLAVAQPGRVKVGDRVVVMPQYPCGGCPLCLQGEYIHCRHLVNPLEATGSVSGTATYARKVLKQDWLLVPVPDDLSLEHAAMACCGLGPTFGAMQSMKVDGFDIALVMGLGPVGLGGVVNGVIRGARVIAVEAHDYRAELAKSLGASAVIHPQDPDALKQILSLTKGVGVDCAVDCSGSPEAQTLMIAAARRKGRIAFVGESGDLTLHVSNDLLRKGLTLYGQWHYNLADTPRIMEVIRRSCALLDQMITHTFPMSRVEEAFALQMAGQCGKILLRPWE